MSSSVRERTMFRLSLAIGVAPFAFGVIRAVTTGNDFRYLWLAFASFLGATAVMLAGNVASRGTGGVLALATVAAIVATLLGTLTVAALQSTVAPVVWLVTFSFGFCCAAGYALNILSRPGRG